MNDGIREIECLFISTKTLLSPYQIEHILTDDDNALISDIISLLSQKISHELAISAFRDTISLVSAQVLCMTGDENDRLT